MFRLRGRTVVNMVLVSAFTVFCLGGLAFLAVGLGLQVPGQGGYLVKADFAATEGLVPQADVLVAGVMVGHVLQVDQAADGGSMVTMRVNNGVALRQDVRAIVRPKSQLGEKYVLLVRGKDAAQAPVSSGFTIHRDHTGAAVEIDDVLNNMDPEARAAFTETLRQLGAAVDGRATDINTTLDPLAQTGANFRPLAATAAARQQNIDHILTSLNTIMAALADEQESLGTLVDSGNTAFGAIASRDRQLAGTVRQADLLFASLDLAFADLTPADRASLEKSPPTIQTGRNLLSLTNPELDRLIPELLLAQVNYPSNQLNVTSPEALALAYEWESAFAQTDAQGHSFRFTNVNDSTQVIRQPTTGDIIGQLPGGGAAPGLPGASRVPGAAGTGATTGGGLPSALQFLLDPQGGIRP